MRRSLCILAPSRIVLLAGLAACGGEGAPSGARVGEGRDVVDISASLELLLGSAVRIGHQVDAGSEAEIFSRILGAQMSPDGRFVVVLDQVPPFVRVFQRDGTLAVAFVPRGGGPGEATSPTAIGVSNDHVLLLEPGRASIFTLGGQLVDERNIGFFPTSVARGCGDDFLAYGPGPDTEGTIVWLRSFGALADPPSAIVEGASPAERRARQRRALGGSSRLARGGELILLHHDARDPPETLTLACPDYRTVAVDTVPEFADPGPTREQRTGDGAIQQPPPAIFVGAAILDQTRILSAWVSGESGTRVMLLDEDAPAFHTSSQMALLDAQPGHSVLLEVLRPVPHVALVDYDAFVRALGLEPK